LGKKLPGWPAANGVPARSFSLAIPKDGQGVGNLKTSRAFHQEK